MSMESGRTRKPRTKAAKAGRIDARPLIGLAAGAAVGSAAIAAALIFSGRLRNPFVDAATIKDDGPAPAKRSRGTKAAAPATSDPEEDASFKRGDA